MKHHRCMAKTSGRWGVLIFLLLVGLGQPGYPSHVQAAPLSSNAAADIGLGFASFITTIPYGAVKVAYATLGGIVGGLTYGLTLGNCEAAHAVWERSMLGTYVLTPSHLTGERKIRFIGP